MFRLSTVFRNGVIQINWTEMQGGECLAVEPDSRLSQNINWVINGGRGNTHFWSSVMVRFHSGLWHTFAGDYHRVRERITFKEISWKYAKDNSNLISIFKHEICWTIFWFFSPYWEDKFGVNILNNKPWNMVKLHWILIPYFFESCLEIFLNNTSNILENNIVKKFWIFMHE